MDLRNYFNKRQPTSAASPQSKNTSTTQQPTLGEQSSGKRKRIVISSDEETDPENPVPADIRSKHGTKPVTPKKSSTVINNDNPISRLRTSPRKAAAAADVNGRSNVTKGNKKTSKNQKKFAGANEDGDDDIVEVIPAKKVNLPPKTKQSTEQPGNIITSDRKDGKQKIATPPGATAPRRSPRKQQKPVSIIEFFSQVSPKEEIRKKEKAPSAAQRPSKQAGEHDDQSFIATLSQLDKHPIETPKKQNGNGLSLAARDVPEQSDNANATRSSPRKRVITSSADAVLPKAKAVKSPSFKKSAALEEVVIDESDTPQSSQHQSDSVGFSSPRKRKSADSNMEMMPQAKILSPKKQVPPQVAPSTPDQGPSVSKKARSSVGYNQYIHRRGPQQLGAREIPEGAEMCFDGLTFVITGVLETIEREDAETLVKKYGGKLTQSVSKKTSYIVAGREPGEAKLAKAAEISSIKVIDEDTFFELLRTLPGKAPKHVAASSTGSVRPGNKRTSDIAALPSAMAARAALPSEKSGATSDKMAGVSCAASASAQNSVGTSRAGTCELWVEKYKPTMLKDIVGQQGEKSPVNKLHKWLANWHTMSAGKARGGGKTDDGFGYKAALLSGPPGIGKTTAAQLACNDLGYSYIEMNASDTRSKKSLKEEVSECVDNQSMEKYAVGTAVAKQQHQRVVLIMDEVDGMAGNEDRGGLQELIAVIRKTRIPIICICNDRQNQKMRSLLNVAYDLRFNRPRVEQIRAKMLTICHREQLKILPPALDQLIEAANHDIRQVLHHLSLLAASQRSLSFEEAQLAAKGAAKEIKQNPFEATRMLFSAAESRKLSLNDKMEHYYFIDYNLMPLMVHDNYLHARQDPSRLDKFAKCADLISRSDLIDKQIRSSGHWTLLPDHGMWSTVLPGEELCGSGLSGMVNFPQWFGKNSKQNKHQRYLQQLAQHMSLHINADTRSLCLDYAPAMRQRFSLLSEDLVRDVARFCDDYDLLKADVDYLLELGQLDSLPDIWASVPSKVKAALTRALNKTGRALPYTNDEGTKKARKRTAAQAMEIMDEEGQLHVTESVGENGEDEGSSDEEGQEAPSALVKTNRKAAAKEAVRKNGGAKKMKR